MSSEKTNSLLIVSHVDHFEFDGCLFAYAPYVREIDVWADLFSDVVIASPLHQTMPPGDAIAFTRRNIAILSQLRTGGDGFVAKAIQLAVLPIHVWRISRAIMQAKAVHVRCPGNLGFIASFLAPFFGKPRVAKYAGRWCDLSGEPWTWRLQKRLLRSRWWGAPVLVYGAWPNQPPHVVPFFTSILDQNQMNRARAVTAKNWEHRPVEVLYVGRLSAAKNVDVLIRAIAEFRAEGIHLRVVGQGPMRGELEQLTRELGVSDIVVFEGGVSPSRVLDFYEKAHMLVLASQTEGWPKAIAEAMAFGLVCIGSNSGLIPQMLGEGRGLLVEPRDVRELVQAIRQVCDNPREAARMSRQSAAWAQRFTLEGLRDALRHQLEKSWNIRLGDDQVESITSAIST